MPPATKSPKKKKPGQLDLLNRKNGSAAKKPRARNGRSKQPAPGVYDESKVKTLSSLEHIRLRTGMYIGRLGDGTDFDDGIYILLKEIVDNAVDEFIMGHGKKIDVKIDAEGRVSVRDYGRGIPLGKVVDCVSVINTGAKYNDDVFQFSVGLNGVGTKAVNALSIDFKVIAYRDGKYSEAVFSQGQMKHQKQGRAPKQPNGTYIEFLPDETIFDEYSYNEEYVERRMWNYACLNSGLRLNFNRRKFVTKAGLFEFLNREVGEDVIYEPCYYKGQYIEFAFTHTGNYGETYYSFVNGQHTSDGGTHQSAFREGILKGVNEYFKKNYGGADVRESITGAVAVKLKEPVFESQTKNKLGNTDVRAWIVAETRSAVVDWLHRNRNTAKKLEDKIIHNEKLRKELNAVKKEAKEAAKKIAIKIPHFKDCKYHLGHKKFGENSTIFITEGPSAAGSMVSARNVLTQAIFSLKGVPMNLHGKTRAAIYKNVEMFNLMSALGIEDSVDSLRFNRVVIATDADHDGFHIRILLLTFILSFFEELVQRGHVYILETPLFRVRNNRETRYCYTPKERDAAIEDIRSPEVTRFKGLGEISPKEFGQFIGEDMRAVKVNLRSLKEVPEMLEFYMGRNTPERKDYIIENLV